MSGFIAIRFRYGPIICIFNGINMVFNFVILQRFDFCCVAALTIQLRVGFDFR